MLTGTEVRKPRICMPSGRLFKKNAFLAGHYEPQDVLQEVDDVEVLQVTGLDPTPAMAARERRLRKLADHIVTTPSL
jgi:hypothetical protein